MPSKKHRLTTYAFFKDIRQSFDAISDENAGALIKALFAADDGEEVDLTGKSETVRGMFPDMWRQMDKLQMMRAKNAKVLIPRSGVPDGVCNGVPDGVPSESQSGAPNPIPNPEPDPLFLKTQSRTVEGVSYIPPETGVFEVKAIRELWPLYVLARRGMRWPVEKDVLQGIAEDVEKKSNHDPRAAETMLAAMIKKPFKGAFKVSVPDDDQTPPAGRFADVPEDWDELGGEK